MFTYFGNKDRYRGIHHFVCLLFGYLTLRKFRVTEMVSVHSTLALHDSLYIKGHLNLCDRLDKQIINKESRNFRINVVNCRVSFMRYLSGHPNKSTSYFSQFMVEIGKHLIFVL